MWVFENLDVYVGSFRQNQFHGRGRWTSIANDVYEGEFVNGLRHGMGTYTTPSGNRYEGQFANDVFEGALSVVCSKCPFSPAAARE